jgi:lipid-A-disaccharide synthase
MFDGVREIHEKFPEACFVLGLAPIISEKDINIPDDMLPYVRISKKGIKELGTVTLVLAASGTVTLQTALSGTPMVTMYKTTAITYAIGRLLVQIPFVAMPNVLAGRKIVPELVQKNATGNKIAAEAIALLTNGIKYSKMSGELLELREKLKGGGGTSEVAKIALKMARGVKIDEIQR